jgi:hypothetical protein
MAEKNKIKQFEDRLSKYLVAGVFGEYALVEVGTDLLPDNFRADVLLIPKQPLPTIQGVGLLTRLTGDARCLIEAFSGSVTEERLEANLAKLRLAIQRSYRDGLGLRYPKGVLWLIFNYWPETAMDAVFCEKGEVVEAGLRRWQGFRRETVYAINTAEIEVREETLLLCLLGKGRQRREAVIKIFAEHIEPYTTLLNTFDRSFFMSQTQHPQQLTPEDLEDLRDLRDTREEVLRELGRKEGREIGLEEGREIGLEEGLEKGLEMAAQRLLQRGLSPQDVAEMLSLPLSRIQDLAKPSAM